MAVKRKKINQLVIYQAPSGAIEFKGDWKKETIWATQAQIASAFGVTPQNITMHLRNVFQDGELDEKTTCKESLQVQKEGKRYIKRKVRLYNLDVVIAVGYRINSVVGTKFRQWATKTLREHIARGYTINRKRIAENYDFFMKAVADIQSLLPQHITLDPRAVVDLIKEFAGTWVSLDAYDREILKPVATYPSVEEKAAHLLYFMVKNHPFTDGNKRAGAFAFIWFLRRYRAKKNRNINPATLTALTLFVAESDSRKKDLMTALITQLLK